MGQFGFVESVLKRRRIETPAERMERRIEPALRSPEPTALRPGAGSGDLLADVCAELQGLKDKLDALQKMIETRLDRAAAPKPKTRATRPADAA